MAEAIMGKGERCCQCDDLTGRAGVADDSLFVGDEGPYCEECYTALVWGQTRGGGPGALKVALGWDKPMTSIQAATYHLTAGFVAYELYADLLRQVESLKSEIELITAPPEAAGNVVFELRRQLEWYKDAIHDMEREVETLDKQLTEAREALDTIAQVPEIQERIGAALRREG